ncbi:SRPBCC family protein [Sorangium sp. So ce1000]|uniref:SRPBCC family protein n=1 Tax=Sorangium sp. So ce1000 TaxID=3133325 RepID=UPI003F5FCDC9
MSAIPPVRRSVIVPLDPASAFDLFARRISEWWPLAKRSAGSSRAVSCAIEGHAGGRVFERGLDGSETLWGKVLVWEPPQRLVITWHPGQRSDEAQEVEVLFLALGGHTRVELEHRGWERVREGAAALRDRFDGGWPSVLARFEALASGEAMPEVTGPGCQGVR